MVCVGTTNYRKIILRGLMVMSTLIVNMRKNCAAVGIFGIKSIPISCFNRNSKMFKDSYQIMPFSFTYINRIAAVTRITT